MQHKFNELPIGAEFELDGERYVKATALLGRRENGTQRLVPRSALVRRLDRPAEADTRPSAAPAAVEAPALLTALDRLVGRCDALLEEGGLSTQERGRLQAGIHAAVDALRTELGF